MAQLVTRIDDQIVARLDELIAEGAVASRSEAVRIGLVAFLDRHRRQRIGELIVASYRERPQTDDEIGWSDEASYKMIADETW